MEKYSKIQKKKKMANPFRKERKNGWKFRLVALLPNAADGIYNGKKIGRPRNEWKFFLSHPPKRNEEEEKRKFLIIIIIMIMMSKAIWIRLFSCDELFIWWNKWWRKMKISIQSINNHKEKSTGTLLKWVFSFLIGFSLYSKVIFFWVKEDGETQCTL